MAWCSHGWPNISHGKVWGIILAWHAMRFRMDGPNFTMAWHGEKFGTNKKVIFKGKIVAWYGAPLGVRMGGQILVWHGVFFGMACSHGWPKISYGRANHFGNVMRFRMDGPKF